MEHRQHQSACKRAASCIVATMLMATLFDAVALADDRDSPRSADAAVVSGVVNINTATEEELTQLPGIGQSKARAIVVQRTQRRFERVEDVMRVKGIGRATFRRLRSMLSVNGRTTLGTAPATTP